MSQNENTVVAHYTVAGMTCAHCVRAVSGEVAAVSGVDEVTVDLDTGALTCWTRPGR